MRVCHWHHIKSWTCCMPVKALLAGTKAVVVCFAPLHYIRAVSLKPGRGKNRNFYQSREGSSIKSEEEGSNKGKMGRTKENKENKGTHVSLPVCLLNFFSGSVAFSYIVKEYISFICFCQYKNVYYTLTCPFWNFLLLVWSGLVWSGLVWSLRSPLEVLNDILTTLHSIT